MRKLLVLLCLCAVPTLAQAQELTKSTINELVKEGNTLVNQAASNKDIGDLVEFYQTHTHEDARFNSVMTYKMQGFPDQTNKAELNKEEYISSIVQGMQGMENYKSTIAIKDITISDDAKTAYFKSISREKGQGSIPYQGGIKMMKINGASKCTHALEVNDDVIQFKNAECETLIIFSE